MALGIPAAKHKRDALATLFPPELNIGATGLSAADMARVLIYMVEKKTICVPGEATSTSVQEVRPGWHFCQFYRDFNELLDLVAPYVAEGLKNGEGCLWVMPEVVTSKAAAAVAQHTENVDAYISSGQLEILPHPQWYLDPLVQLKTFE
ncbi:MAG: MEDS domain-containing protein, partial [Vulcanimicrobiaceae bacterium]